MHSQLARYQRTFKSCCIWGMSLQKYLHFFPFFFLPPLFFFPHCNAVNWARFMVLNAGSFTNLSLCKSSMKIARVWSCTACFCSLVGTSLLGRGCLQVLSRDFHCSTRKMSYSCIQQHLLRWNASCLFNPWLLKKVAKWEACLSNKEEDTLREVFCLCKYVVPCCQAFFQSMGEGVLSICDNKVTFKLKINLKQFS